jgi:hypothetical protein
VLTKAKKKKGLSLYKQYKDWTGEEWNRVMFSDKSMFRINSAASKYQEAAMEQPVQPQVHSQDHQTFTCVHDLGVLY